MIISDISKRVLLVDSDSHARHIKAQNIDREDVFSVEVEQADDSLFRVTITYSAGDYFSPG